MEQEVVLFNYDKNLYLYVQDNQSDEECDTEYTVYDIYGNDQDGGLLSAESYELKSDQEVINWIFKELKWDQDETVKLDQDSQVTFLEMVTEWDAQKIKNARYFTAFKRNQEKQWKK